MASSLLNQLMLQWSYKSYLSLLALFVCCFYAQAQTTDSLTQADSIVAFNKDFLFTDGIYKNLEQLKTNKPVVQLAFLGGSLVYQESEYLLKVEKLHPQGHPEKSYELEDYPIISYKGRPFFKIGKDSIRNFYTYAGLRLRGMLSYYAYEQTYIDSVLIQAYNPATGVPFRSQMMSTEQSTSIRKVVNMETGELFDFDLENMPLILAADTQLLKTFEAMNKQEALEKMERFLLIYDDRNPLFLPKAVEKN